MTRASHSATDSPILVLFRNDLRVADNRALAAAAETDRPVVPVFILDEESEGMRPAGAASRWWLHHALAALEKRIDSLGSRLILRRGAMQSTVADLVENTGAGAVFWNRRYAPAQIAVDTKMKAALRDAGIETQSFDGYLLHEPSVLRTGSGGPYKVYTPFWRALSAGPDPRDPVDAPARLAAWSGRLHGDTLASWNLLPRSPDWAAGFHDVWTPGEDGAQARLKAFIDGPIDGYGEGRDRPAKASTSGLSPHLTHGEITPFQIFAALRSTPPDASSTDVEKFRKEVGWREFCYHLLFHNPDLATRNFNSDFDGFQWQPDADVLRAWKRGRTGYPIVDAGMRELWSTGVMHNRVRMITASFLIKHLLTDWREGEKWFWDTLVDADPASNPANWQWVAGSGADASPYFRIFNPMLQGEKFDPNGDYVRRYVPEIAALPDRYIHQPWKMPAAELRDAGVKLGDTYPVPLIDHDDARARAMQHYKSMRGD